MKNQTVTEAMEELHNATCQLGREIARVLRLETAIDHLETGLRWLSLTATSRPPPLTEEERDAIAKKRYVLEPGAAAGSNRAASECTGGCPYLDVGRTSPVIRKIVCDRLEECHDENCLLFGVCQEAPRG